MRYIFLIISILSYQLAFTQTGKLGKQNYPQLELAEKHLSNLALGIINGKDEFERAKACYVFIPKLVDALKTENSFHYKFTKLKNISILYPEDSTFRIFTWQLQMNNKSYRYYGAIQKNKADLELYPLYDYSDSLYYPVDTVLDHNHWYGCLYYNMVTLKHKKKTYYTLFGWDGYDLWSTRKIIDILTFNKEGKPIFGSPIIQFEDDLGNKSIKNRFMLEYKADVIVTLNYSEKEGKILYEHLIPMQENTVDLRFSYVPDGSYCGFEAKKGKWIYIDKVFDYKRKGNDNPPIPKPVQFNE